MSALKSIFDMVQERRLQPGDRLPSERDLAERLGIGRNAVREGLAALTTLRVLEARPNSGIYLKRVNTESSFETLAMLAELGAMPTPAEIAETTEVRLALERLAVLSACARRTDEDVERMEQVLSETEALLREGGNIAELDTAFHLALANASHNSVLVRVLNSFYRLTAERRRAWFQNHAQGRSSARDHRRLLQAVIDRDAAAAQKHIEKHMQRASAYWDELLR
jgi:GntR family transcriptional repressor for pyruvate dehydrogenase complex